MNSEIFIILGWGSPIGVGVFLALLGTMIFLLTKADETSKRVKMAEKKSREKKELNKD